MKFSRYNCQRFALLLEAPAESHGNSFCPVKCFQNFCLCGITAFCNSFCYVKKQFYFSTNGDGEIRTHDPLLARQVLSQLSYTPIYKMLVSLANILCFIIRQPPAFPYRLQYSIIGRLSLNHRVRDVDGCFP